MILTVRAVAYLAFEEGIVPEAYLDTGNVWTWAIGLTAASGVKVQQYVNRPAPLDVCIKATINRLNAVYLPQVNRTFAGHALNDAQLAAALSFHWNTGAIDRAHWVKDWLAGDTISARHELTNNYLNGGILTARREREAGLFFNGVWPADMRCPVRSVSKPGYHPIKPVATDIIPMLQQILGGK